MYFNKTFNLYSVINTLIPIKLVKDSKVLLIKLHVYQYHAAIALSTHLVLMPNVKFSKNMNHQEILITCLIHSMQPDKLAGKRNRHS